MADKNENAIEKGSSLKIKLQAFICANIFKFKKGDAIGYFVFYIIIPIIITTVSLIQNHKGNPIDSVYCYMTILISALNAIYDGGNRWTVKKSPQNIKIFIIFLSNIVVSIYCAVMIFIKIVLSDKFLVQADQVLFSYMGSVIIALIDIIACFTKDMALEECIKEENN